jgi:hypothetical protein
MAKGSKKAGKANKEPKNWAKLAIPILLVFIMLGSIVAYVSSGNWANKIGTTETTGLTKKFDSLADGLKLVPAGAASVRYIDLRNDSVISGSINNFYWLKGAMPSKQIFNVDPVRDMFSIYPAGFFGSFAEQFVSLTDFGTAKINKTYPDYYNINNVIAKKVNDRYFYTAETSPVISGRIENVAPTIDVISGNNASAYGNYSDLLDEIKLKHLSAGNMTLEVVGLTSNLSNSDRFYAAIGPVDRSNKSTDRLYSYVAVMHLNSTISDQDRLNLALLQGGMQKMGFKSYNTQVYDDYIVIDATGSLTLCLDDMLNRWGFLKYSASL